MNPYTRRCEEYRREGVPYLVIAYSQGSMFVRLGEYKVPYVAFNQWGEQIKRTANVHFKAKAIYKAYKKTLWSAAVYCYLDPLPEDEQAEFETYFGPYAVKED